MEYGIQVVGLAEPEPAQPQFVLYYFQGTETLWVKIFLWPFLSQDYTK